MEDQMFLEYLTLGFVVAMFVLIVLIGLGYVK